MVQEGPDRQQQQRRPVVEHDAQRGEPAQGVEPRQPLAGLLVAVSDIWLDVTAPGMARGATPPGPAAAWWPAPSATGRLLPMPTEPLTDGAPRTSPPRWLTDDEQRAWRAYIRLAQLLMRQLDRDLHPFGLSMHDYEILVELSEAPRQPAADDRARRPHRAVPQQALPPDQPDGDQGPGQPGGLRGRQARHVRGADRARRGHHRARSRRTTWPASASTSSTSSTPADSRADRAPASRSLRPAPRSVPRARLGRLSTGTQNRTDMNSPTSRKPARR